MDKCFDGGNCGEGGFCDDCPLLKEEGVPVKSQCDSCNAGHYKDAHGMHRDENGMTIMACHGYKYK